MDRDAREPTRARAGVRLAGTEVDEGGDDQRPAEDARLQVRRLEIVTHLRTK